MEQEKNEGWSMASVWNKSLEDQEVRPVTPREKLWASELGRPPIEIYLKMKGTVPTNPPNARALRKFEAGNVFEWIVSLVLKRAGILKQGQAWCEYQYPGLLPVSGKADFIAGGVVDVNKATEFITFLKEAEIPDVFLRCFDRVIKHLAEKYPNELDEMPLEVKSISAYAMDLLETTQTPSKMHRIQIFHYLKAMDYKKGNLIYICRDDLRMMEFTIFRDSPVEDEYKDKITTISKYFYAGEQPPKEKNIIFDSESGKFSKNLGIEWSNYLTLLYGYNEPREYGEQFSKVATKWNRVLKRVFNKDKITAKNDEVLKEIRDAGYDPDEIIKNFKPVELEEEVAE